MAPAAFWRPGLPEPRVHKQKNTLRNHLTQLYIRNNLSSKSKDNFRVRQLYLCKCVRSPPPPSYFHYVYDRAK